MATLENIRKKGPLIAIVIGLALFAFILGDLVKSGGSLFSGSQKEIAVIDGESVSIDEYQALYAQLEEVYRIQTGNNSLDQNTQKQIQEQIWEEIVRKYIFTDRYEENGIGVSDLELAEMVRGQNIDADPSVKQLFTDQQTGVYNSAAAINFFLNIDQNLEYKKFGLYLEKQMRENKKYTKYATLIAKGLNVTDFEARQLYKERVQLVDFEFVGKSYLTIADSTITVSENEIKKYYDQHKDEYKQQHTRDLAYITFEVVPSQKDFDDTKKELEAYYTDFAEIKVDTSTENAINFVNANSQNSFDYRHLTLEELGDSSLFYAELGTTKGPVLENGYYKLKKLIARTNVPDSVEARHILIQPDGREILDMAQAKIVADSIKKLIDNGADFEKLAISHSADQGSATKGGDLGKLTEGQMVKPFNDACFYGKTGDLKVVESQFGVHIINVTWQSKAVQKVQIAVIDKEVMAQSATLADYFNKAREFSANAQGGTKAFDAQTEKFKLIKKVALDLTPSTEVIAGIEDARQIINWAFKDETEEGNVSDPFQSGKTFVVAIVSSIKEEGIAPVEQVKEAIIAKLRIEEKGVILSKEIKDAIATDKDFKSVAAKIKGNANEAKNVSFSASRIPNLGAELPVIGAAFSTQKDQISDPIIGTTGVFVIKVSSFTGVDNFDNIDLSNDKRNVENRMKFRINREAYTAVKKSVEIKDLRYKFF